MSEPAKELIERVAHAIASEDGCGTPAGYFPSGQPMRHAEWDWFMPDQHDAWRRMARAALRAATASPESFSVSQDEPSQIPASKSADLDAEPSALARLLARVEAATGGDRELDLLLAQAFDGLDPRACVSPKGIIGYVDRGQWAQPFVPPYTASLDTALALCERALPKWAWMLRASPDAGNAFAKTWKPFCDPPGNDFDALVATPALALLCAMLKALVAQRTP